jgi:hypothetical protein
MPPNTCFNIQPMDYTVIATFKWDYSMDPIKRQIKDGCGYRKKW